MTYVENKKIALALIEEYAPNNKVLTDDDDIAQRIALIYAPAYQELSQNKKILATKEYSTSNEVSDSFTAFTLPANLYQFKKIYALDDNNNDQVADYKIIGKKIYISNKISCKYILEYYKYPEIIAEDSPNDFELELEQDALMLLPYQVANDILKVDASANYQAFLSEYQRKLDGLDSRRTVPTVIIEEGEL